MTSPLSLQRFQKLVYPLIGLPVSRTHEGYYTTALFHLGKLKERHLRDRSIFEGEASLMLEHQWRVEREKDIWFSSLSSKDKREQGLADLVGKSVRSINVEGRLPELVIELSDNIWVKSFSLEVGQPQWSVFSIKGSCIFSQSGELMFESPKVRFD